MTQEERMGHLISFLHQENPRFPDTAENIHQQKHLLRNYMNVRQPAPLPQEILEIQDAYLQEELKGKVISLSTLTPLAPNQYVWQGDITKLGVDAIVNAANSGLLGCFHAGHTCVDNVIHTNAGMQLRLACHEIMEAQGTPEAIGNAKLTPAFNLPSRYVIHTVGPSLSGNCTPFHEKSLENCYQSCLDLALSEGLHSIAFCCISTGEFHFPQDLACDIATNTVKHFLEKHPNSINVVFNVYKNDDFALYTKKFA